MKNLLIISSRYPHKYNTISSIFVYSQVEELKKKFNEIFVIATTPYIPRFLKRGIEPKRQVDSLAQNYSYDNVQVYFTRNIVLPLESLKRLRGWQGYRSTVKILNKNSFKPDFIHAHFTWPSGYIALKLKEKMQIPYFITAHGHDIYDMPFRNDYYNKNIKKVLENSNHIITVSQKNKKIMTDKLGVNDNKITVIPNGFNPNLFYPINKQSVRKKLKLPLNKKIVLSIGNLMQVKGHKYLIESAKNVIKKRKDVLFLIVGEGSERKNLEDNIKKNKLGEYIKLMGPKPHDTISMWINSCDIFVLPSLDEGVPTVLFETLACGKPVVGTQVGGIPEIIKDDNLGFLVSSRDSINLADKIINGLNKDWDSEIITNYALEFSWGKIVNKIMNIYK